MPNAILRPAAVGAYDAWGLTAGANKVVAVDPGDPVSHDDATSYITSTAAGQIQSYTVLSAGSPAIGTITTLLIRDRDNDVGSDTLGAFVRVAGVDGVQQNVVVGTSAAWTTRTLATNPLKSGSVALLGTDIRYSDVNFQIAIKLQAGGTNINSTSFWGDLTFLYPPGGFVCVIGQWLGPLVAVGLAEMRRLATALAQRSGCLITPDEYETAWRELREGRRARHFLMGMR